MQRTLYIAACAVLALYAAAPAASAQQSLVKSRSSGFFVGLGLEGNGLTSSENGTSATDNGGGAGLVLGYGITPRWALYTELSGASMSSGNGGDSYSLGHFDVGARVHFRTGPNIVVPFIQFGLSGRALRQDVPDGFGGTSTVDASGAGVSFGGGLNAHFTPAFAFSGSVAWTVGNFGDYKVDGQPVSGDSFNATTARVHLGIIWFPGA
jgi:hypothetical protein